MIFHVRTTCVNRLAYILIWTLLHPKRALYKRTPPSTVIFCQKAVRHIRCFYMRYTTGCVEGIPAILLLISVWLVSTGYTAFMSVWLVSTGYTAIMSVWLVSTGYTVIHIGWFLHNCRHWHWSCKPKVACSTLVCAYIYFLFFFSGGFYMLIVWQNAVIPLGGFCMLIIWQNAVIHIGWFLHNCRYWSRKPKVACSTLVCAYIFFYIFF